MEDGWCATKVDNNGKYTGDFGMCHENCPTESPSKICATTYRVQALPITIILTIIIKYEIPYHLDISYVQNAFVNAGSVQLTHPIVVKDFSALEQMKNPMIGNVWDGFPLAYLRQIVGTE